MVRGPSRRSVSGRETFLEFGKWSEDPTEGPEVVGELPGGLNVVGGTSQIFGNGWGPFRRSGSGQGNHPEVRKWSGDPSGGPEVVWGPYRRSGSGRGTILEVRK